MARDKHQQAFAAKATQVEDQVLAELMRYIRKYNGNPEGQGFVCDLIKDNIRSFVGQSDELRAQKPEDDEARFEREQHCLIIDICTFGCASILQKATEEGLRFDREEGK